MVATFLLSPGSCRCSHSIDHSHGASEGIHHQHSAGRYWSAAYLVDLVIEKVLGGCQHSIMGEQGEDTAQYSIRPPDSAKFRAGAVKVRMQHLG